MQVALRDLRDDVGDDLVAHGRLCLDEYTDHGHCGVLDADGEVDNDATIELYARAAVAQAEAGADVIAPSGMMDGQVGAIRAGARRRRPRPTWPSSPTRPSTPRRSYGPFRDAVDVQIAGGGDRKGYQQDWRNAREALEEIRADLGEGADMVMVKPALAYLDVIAAVRAELDVPVAAYHVSRRVRDDQGGGRRRLDRRRRRWRSSTSPPSSGPAPTSSSPTWPASWPRRSLDPRALNAVAIPFCDPDRCPAADCAPVTCARLRLASNDELFERAQRVIPGGVNSPVRAFRSVGGTPYFVARAEGPYVWDVEGTRYIDLVQCYGAIILGHAHPAVVEAVTDAAADGTSYGAPTPREVLLAEAIAERVPSVEQVRLVTSGTEATMTAIRVARGVTGRRKS